MVAENSVVDAVEQKLERSESPRTELELSVGDVD